MDSAPASNQFCSPKLIATGTMKMMQSMSRATSRIQNPA
jgi:hypothetical protein